MPNDIEEFVTLANENEKYPVNVQQTTTDIEKTIDRKQFKSKHFGRAENICCLATSVTFILLFAIWIYFETKEADI